MEEKIEQKKVSDFKPFSDSHNRPAGRGFGGGAGGSRGPRRGFRGKERVNDGFESKLLDLARVVRVTGGGKRLRFRAVVIAGDKKGKIGIGVDKGRDVSQAIEKATNKAKKSLVSVIIVDGTISHEVEAKVGPARILLKPQKKGRGLVAGGAVRSICELAGIRNISSKILSGSKNKLNNARATMEALKKLKAKS
ncbi:MAG: 30S ribosomal protein S5 [Candidatus Staskawiczbacteria bacterium]|nr:30S ribosomal protein S5 [Candidatus Staskawiczbacteria bacterium]